MTDYDYEIIGSEIAGLNAAPVGRLMAEMPLAPQASRGSRFREDYPDTDHHWAKHEALSREEDVR